MTARHVPLPTQPAFYERSADLLRQLWIRLDRWQTNRMAIQALQELDAHALKDLGVARCAIESAVKSRPNSTVSTDDMRALAVGLDDRPTATVTFLHTRKVPLATS